MTSEQIINRFRDDYGLSGRRWRRFCRRYVSRNLTTVICFIRGRYGKVPVEFRDCFIAEMQRGCRLKK